MPKKFSDTSQQSITDNTKILAENNSVIDGFAHITGANIDSYIKAKLSATSEQTIEDDDYVFSEKAGTIGKTKKSDLFDERINYYDATVGTGGDYADIAAAQTDGKYILKAVGDVTISADTTILNNIYIDLCGFTMICSTYRFIYSAGSLKIKNGFITTSITSNLNLFGSNTYAEYLTITNSGAGRIAVSGDFVNCTIILASGASSFGNLNTQFSGNLTNIIITGTNTTGFPFYARRGNFKNIKINGSFLSSATIMFACVTPDDIININYFYNSSTSATTIVRTQNITGGILIAENIYCPYGFFRCSGNVSKTKTIIKNLIAAAVIEGVSEPSAMIQNAEITNFTETAGLTDINTVTFKNAVTLTKNKTNINNCEFLSTLSISGDYNLFVNCRFTGAVTINAGAEYNIFCNCYFTAGLINNSGNQTNEINNNI